MEPTVRSAPRVMTLGFSPQSHCTPRLHRRAGGLDPSPVDSARPSAQQYSAGVSGCLLRARGGFSRKAEALVDTVNTAQSKEGAMNNFYLLTDHVMTYLMHDRRTEVCLVGKTGTGSGEGVLWIMCP